jgi:(p)ppGpp synthase/HD superfamily hydrolase
MSEMQSLSLLVRACDFAAKKHSTQRRKDQAQTPYINHPIGVARILVDEGEHVHNNVKQIICNLNALHKFKTIFSL